jgi:hypothetical protein
MPHHGMPHHSISDAVLRHTDAGQMRLNAGLERRRLRAPDSSGVSGQVRVGIELGAVTNYIFIRARQIANFLFHSNSYIKVQYRLVQYAG